MRVRSASCRFFRFSRFLLFVSIAPLPKTARQTDNSLALCLRLFERRGDGVEGVRGSAVGSLVGSTICSVARPPRKSTDRKV